MLLLYYGRFFFNVQNPTSMISTALNGRHDVEKKTMVSEGVAPNTNGGWHDCS